MECCGVGQEVPKKKQAVLIVTEVSSFSSPVSQRSLGRAIDCF